MESGNCKWSKQISIHKRRKNTLNTPKWHSWTINRIHPWPTPLLQNLRLSSSTPPPGPCPYWMFALHAPQTFGSLCQKLFQSQNQHLKTNCNDRLFVTRGAIDGFILLTAAPPTGEWDFNSLTLHAVHPPNQFHMTAAVLPTSHLYLLLLEAKSRETLQLP